MSATRRFCSSLATRTFARPVADTSRTFATKGSPYPPSLLTNINAGIRYHTLHKQGNSVCYRQMRNKSDAPSNSPTFRERLSDLRRNGTPEIVIGFVILTVVGVDYFLQMQTDQQRQDMKHQLEREVRRDEASTHEEDKKLLNNEGAITKLKFQCIIRKVPQNFDGHKCLKNVKVGDVINVLEEGVGPGGQYNLCSIGRGNAKNATKDSSGEYEKRVSIGWYPCSCLEKIE